MCKHINSTKLSISGSARDKKRGMRQLKSLFWGITYSNTPPTTPPPPYTHYIHIKTLKKGRKRNGKKEYWLRIKKRGERGERGQRVNPKLVCLKIKKGTASAAAAVSHMIKARKIVNNTHCSNKLLREKI